MIGINGTRALTYADFAKGLDSKGNFVNRVINLATRENEMLDDITVIEANNGTTLETSFRTETPKPVWTAYYTGVPSAKGSKAKMKVSCGKMASKIIVDKQLYDEARDKDAILNDEISSILDGMRMEMGNMLVYGKLAENPLGFNGLFKHYDAYGSDFTDEYCVDDRESAFNVVSALDVAGSASDTSDLGSIALIGWSPNTITCFHAEGHKSGGISVSEKQVTQVVDPDGPGDATYEAELRYMRWELGLAVRDYRFGGRLCNIQRNHLLDKGKEGDYLELIDRLTNRVRDNGVRQALYMDKRIWEKICTLYSRLTRGNAITFQQIEGRKEKKLFGIPVRIQDCMSVKEEKVEQFVEA